MSYIEREQSGYGGHPLELYRFALGDMLWLFTSADHEVAFVGDVYQPVFIRRSGFTRTGDARKSSMEIEVAVSNPLALQFRSGWLGRIMTITVYRHHWGDIEYSVQWKGRVVGCRWGRDTATLVCDTASTLFTRAGLRRVYQILCPHVLYEQGIGLCNVDPAAYQFDTTITNVAGNMITVAGGAYPDGYFTAGKVMIGADYRLIVSHVANVVTLLDMSPAAEIGGAISLWPGCAKTMEVCGNTFHNLDNFGGLPFIPKKSPFGGGALV